MAIFDGGTLVDVVTKPLTEQEMQVREYISHYISERRKTDTVEKLATEFHLSKPQVLHASRGWKIGSKTVDAVAAKLFRGSVDELRREAAKHWEASGAVFRLAPAVLVQRNVELAKAIDFLRGEIPDDYLDQWIATRSSHGWKDTNRHDFEMMIRANYRQEKASATDDLAEARKARVSKRNK